MKNIYIYVEARQIQLISYGIYNTIEEPIRIITTTTFTDFCYQFELLFTFYEQHISFANHLNRKKKSKHQTNIHIHHNNYIYKYSNEKICVCCVLFVIELKLLPLSVWIWYLSGSLIVDLIFQYNLGWISSKDWLLNWISINQMNLSITQRCVTAFNNHFQLIFSHTWFPYIEKNCSL